MFYKRVWIRLLKRMVMAILKIIEANNSLGRPEKRNPEQNREEGQVCCFVKGVETEVTISKAFK